MLHPPVVTQSPKTSALAHIVSCDDSPLAEILQWVSRANALNRALAETRAELKAMREGNPHRDYLADEPKQLSEFPSYDSTPTSSNEVRAQEDIKQQHERGWKHVAGIKASKSVVIRDWNVTTRPNFCSTCTAICKEYVSMSHDGAGGISCKDYIEQRKVDTEQQEAKRTKTLEEYCTEYKKKNNTRLSARGWLGYSPEEMDLDIIEARGRSAAEKITKFDKKLWNKSPRAKGKWRIQ